MKFMIYFPVLVLATTLGMDLVSAETKGNSPHLEPFHIAKSDAEKILDSIIHLTGKDANMYAYALGLPWYDAKKNTGYSRLFTKNFLRVAAKAELDAVKENCSGEYRDDDICGLDYDIFTCQESTSEKGYLYRTKEDNGQMAIIYYLWVGESIEEDRTFYKLIKDGGNWKLDGIDCGNGVKFNMGLVPTKTKSKSSIEDPFHFARSDAEKALDGMIRRAHKDHNIFEYVLGTPEYDAKKDTGYSRLFTKTFLQTVVKKQSDAVKKECAGKTDEGIKCSQPISPFACSQDFSIPGHRLRTIKNDGRKALIFYEWVGNRPVIGKTLYRLVKVRGIWKLDDMDCGDGDKFNMN